MSVKDKKSVTERLTGTSPKPSIKIKVYYGDKRLVDCMKSIICIYRSRNDQGE